MPASRPAGGLLPAHGPARWASHPAPPTAASYAPDRWALALVQRPFRDVPLRFQLWDGTALGAPAAQARATIVIRNRGVLLGLLLDPEMAFGDGYSTGAIDVEGDLPGMIEAAYDAFRKPATIYRDWLRRAVWIEPRGSLRPHHVLSSDFYRFWLDDRLVLSCGYFSDRSLTLEQAQRAKLEYVCRKLRVQPGDRVIEAGGGWGALAIHMAAKYGAGVKSYNISHEQTLVARERAQRAGVADRVEFIEDDFRNIQGHCDAFVSIGMLEHIGARHLADLGVVIDRSLDRGHGRGLLHFAGRNQGQELSAWIRRRIRPDAYVPTIAEVTDAVLEPWELTVVDMENLRLHYADTLAHWTERFEQAAGSVRQMYDEPFVRAWRLYLAGSLVAFRTGGLQLFQLTFARTSVEYLPRTRAYLYEPDLAL